MPEKASSEEAASITENDRIAPSVKTRMDSQKPVAFSDINGAPQISSSFATQSSGESLAVSEFLLMKLREMIQEATDIEDEEDGEVIPVD